MAKERGVDGVPSFVTKCSTSAKSYLLGGAQESDTFFELFEKLVQ